MLGDINFINWVCKYFMMLLIFSPCLSWNLISCISLVFIFFSYKCKVLINGNPLYFSELWKCTAARSYCILTARCAQVAYLEHWHEKNRSYWPKAQCLGRKKTFKDASEYSYPFLLKPSKINQTFLYSVRWFIQAVVQFCYLCSYASLLVNPWPFCYLLLWLLQQLWFCESSFPVKLPW